MPAVNGAEATARILHHYNSLPRRTQQQQQSPVLVHHHRTACRSSSLSSSVDANAVFVIGITGVPEARDVCLAAGMADVIFKPFHADTIEGILNTFL